MTTLNGKIPSTYRESSRWFPVFNGSEFDIEPFAPCYIFPALQQDFLTSQRHPLTDVMGVSPYTSQAPDGSNATRSRAVLCVNGPARIRGSRATDTTQRFGSVTSDFPALARVGHATNPLSALRGKVLYPDTSAGGGVASRFSTPEYAVANGDVQDQKQVVMLSSDSLTAREGLCWVAPIPKLTDLASGVGKGHVFVLTSNLAAGVGQVAAATITVSGEFGILAGEPIAVYNTGLKKGFVGAVGWAVKIGDEYWLSEIDQYAMWSLITFSADTHGFSVGSTTQGKVADQDPITTSSFVALTPYPFSFLPTPRPTIHNPHNLIGLSGDDGIVAWNDNAGWFELIAILPVEKRRIQFELSDDMPTETITTTTDFTVLQAAEYTAGDVPVPTTLSDPMKLVINGLSGQKGEAEYSYRDEAWRITSFYRGETAGNATYLYTLTGTISGGTGTATIRNLADDTEIETGATLKDPLGHFAGLTSGYRGMCVKEGDDYYALGPYVVGVAWVDPTLRQTKDGTTYTTIDTAEDCV